MANKETNKGFVARHWGKIVLTGGLGGLIFVELANYYKNKVYLPLGVLLVFGAIVIFYKNRNND